MEKKNQEIAGLIEHTLLRPDATSEDVLRTCQEAIRFGFKAVCLHLSHVSYAVEILEGKKPFAVKDICRSLVSK